MRSPRPIQPILIFLGLAISISELISQPALAQNLAQTKAPKLIPVEPCPESLVCDPEPVKTTKPEPKVTTNAEPEVLRVKLFEDSASSEWIRLEKNGNVIKILHTRSRPSDVTRFLARAFFFPQIYNWDDHPVSRIVFIPDNCPALKTSSLPSNNINDCMVISTTDTITLKDDTDIRQGSFTIEYMESNLSRTVTFKIRN